MNHHLFQTNTMTITVMMIFFCTVKFLQDFFCVCKLLTMTEPVFIFFFLRKKGVIVVCSNLLTMFRQKHFSIFCQKARWFSSIFEKISINRPLSLTYCFLSLAQKRSFVDGERPETRNITTSWRRGAMRFRRDFFSKKSFSVCLTKKMWVFYCYTTFYCYPHQQMLLLPCNTFVSGS